MAGGLLAASSISSASPGASSTTSIPAITSTMVPIASVPCGVVASPEITFTSKTDPARSGLVGVTIHVILIPGA